MDDGDILGRKLKLTRQQHEGFVDSSGAVVWQLVLWTVAAAVAGYAVKLGYEGWRSTQETRYKKMLRRRHGIPDDDHRPFNVAYAAARQRREDEACANGQLKREPLDEVMQRLHKETESRQRDAVQPSGVSTATDRQSRPALPVNGPNDPPNGVDFNTRYNPPPIQVSEPAPRIQPRLSGLTRTPLTPRSSFKPFISNGKGKRRLEAEDQIDSAHAKKSRVQGEEYIDGDEEPNWTQGDGGGLPGGLYRGEKRVMDDYDVEPSSPRKLRIDKRARKVSRDHTPEDQEMEDADQVTELVRSRTARGKKRDRAEAGSTFGGDDDDRSDVEVGKRKKRTVAKHKSDAHKGHKRERDSEIGSDTDAEMRAKAKAARKAKRSSLASRRSDEDDASMADSDLTIDSQCRGRRIGEEWEANGTKYKVGPNGQRLRLAYVKSARQKYAMPKDSQHPDTQKTVDVFVEQWLSDEQYQEAKDRFALHWQESPNSNAPAPPDTPGNVPDSPSKGKELLWHSTTAQGSPALKRGVFRQSIATNVGLRTADSLQDLKGGRGRRVTSGYTGGMDSPAAGAKRMFRTFSKWEKQELEAEAMARLRRQSQGTPSPLASATTPAPSLSFTAPTPPLSSVPTETKASATSTAAPTPLGVPPASTASSDTGKAAVAHSAPAATAPQSIFQSAATTPAVAVGAVDPSKPKPPSHSFTWGTKPAAPSDPPKAPTAPSTFSFGVSSSTKSSEGVDKAAAVPAPSFVSSNSSTDNAAPSTSATVPNFFSNTSTSAPSQNNNTAPSQSKPKGSSPFGLPSGPASSTPAAASSPFSFGQPAKIPETAKPSSEVAQTPGGSLLDRMAPTSVKATAPVASNPTFGGQANAPIASNPNFKFPGSGPPKPLTLSASPFGQAKAPVASNPTSVSSSSVPPKPPTPSSSPFGAPKASTSDGDASKANPGAFSFGFSKPLVSTTPGGSNPEPTKTSMPAFGAAAPKAFSFGGTSTTPATTPTAPANTPTAPANTPSKQAFNFGTSAPAASGDSKDAAKEPAKAAFGGFGSGPSAFSSTPAGSPNLFATSSGTPSPFGATASTSKPSGDALKSGNPGTFGGSGSTSSPFGAAGGSNTTGEAPKSVFGGGSSNASSPFGSTSAPSLFGGNGAPSAFGSATAPSPFGGTSAPSAFGAAATAKPFMDTTTPKVQSVFSGTSAPAAESSAPGQGTGGVSFNFGGTPQSTPSGGAEQSKSSPSAFGFGAGNATTTSSGSNPFTFGSNVPKKD